MACIRRRRGRWILDFRDAQGRRRWETYRTRKEADSALSERLRQLTRGTYCSPSAMPTIAELARDWLATKMDRRPSAYAQWQVHLDLHIVPQLGTFRLNQVKVTHVEEFKRGRLEAGLAPATVNKLLTTATALFNYAIRRELIDRNPAGVVERCALRSGEIEVASSTPNWSSGNREVDPHTVLSPAEAAQLVANAQAGYYRTFFLTALLTGARVGELTALTWSDVDFDQRTIAISRNVSWAKKRGMQDKAKPKFYSPKTASGTRTIEIAPELVAALRRWKFACPRGEMNLVFPNRQGSPRHRGTIAHDGLVPALHRAKLRHVTIHSLRHTCASSMILEGKPVTEIAYFLGHSSPDVTLRYYAHWWKTARSEAALPLAKVVCGGAR